MAAPDKPAVKIGDVFAHGATEVVIRVCEYDADLKTPLRFQAIVRHRVANRPWGVATGLLPLSGLQEAMRAFMATPAEAEEEDDLI